MYILGIRSPAIIKIERERESEAERAGVRERERERERDVERERRPGFDRAHANLGTVTLVQVGVRKSGFRPSWERT